MKYYVIGKIKADSTGEIIGKFLDEKDAQDFADEKERNARAAGGSFMTRIVSSKLDLPLSHQVNLKKFDVSIEEKDKYYVVNKIGSGRASLVRSKHGNFFAAYKSAESIKNASKKFPLSESKLNIIIVRTSKNHSIGKTIDPFLPEYEICDLKEIFN